MNLPLETRRDERKGPVLVTDEPAAAAEGFAACDAPFVVTTRVAERLMNNPAKRLFDLAVGGIGFLVLLPLFGFLALLVKLTSKGPVFFRQERVGIGKSLFRIYKYRTMYIDAPKDVPKCMFNESCRFITPIGRFLRRSSLDELPQILNVLRGEMSLVGPRPHIPNEHELFRLRDRYGANDVRPGITGWAQINGRDEIGIPEKVALDAYYIRHWSFGFDLKILCLTAWKVLRGEGIHEGRKDWSHKQEERYIRIS